MNIVLRGNDRQHYLWSHLVLLKWLAQTLPPKSASAWLELSEDLARTKRNIRALRDEQPQLKGTIIKDYGIDGFIERIDLPDVKSQEEAMEAARKITFDCGLMFTAWARVVKRGDGYAIYHRVATDT